jgi:hypothetical protein
VTAKEYLRQLKTLDNMVNAKLLEKERIQALTTRVSVGSSERVQSGGGGGFENVVIRLGELKDEINTDVDKLYDLKIEAGELISRIEDKNLQIILSMYYISNSTFEQVAENTDMSSRWVRKLHGKAIKKFEEIYSCSC